MMASVQSAWRTLSREKLLRIHGEFLWPADESFKVTVRRPSHDDQSRRSINEIPLEEIATTIKNLKLSRVRFLIAVAISSKGISLIDRRDWSSWLGRLTVTVEDSSEG